MMLSLLTVTAALSQPPATPTAPPTTPPAATTPTPAPATPAPAKQPPATPPPAPPVLDLSAPATLGRRIAAVRAQTTVAPILVLVESGYAFNEALAGWHTDKGRVLYPILCDFKTQESRENIARFVRAFKPARIVRLKGPDDSKLPALPPQATIESLLYSTFGAKDEAGYLAALAARPDAPGPLGVVVTQHGTPGCNAAVALAAAYGELLVYADAPAAPGAPVGFPAADKLSGTITGRLAALKLSFAGLGDQIDAVTLCYDTAANVVAATNEAPDNPIPQLVCKPGESLALTDIIGRSINNNRQDRWAYASLLTGSFSQSTYRAMCAIFLQPTSAAAFNGYERSGEFGKYDPAEGLKALKAAGMQTGYIDRPNQSADDWRQWASGSFATTTRFPETAGTQPSGGALTTDLFLINTMGNRDFFQLKPGYCYAGDAPFLNLPAAVNFTHSWSLEYSNDPTTVGGRWLDRGAYCYIGSVHEPYLSAFVPQSELVQRLTRGWPIAAAARIQANDQPPSPFAAPWRIAILGDALWTLGPALKRTTDLPTFTPATTDLVTELSPALKARRYADAFDTLTMLGRDDDAARLARAAFADEPEKIDHAAALRAVMIAYRAGDSDTLVKAAQKLDPAAQGGPNTNVSDAIWHALWPKLNSINADQAQLLASTVRTYSYAWDTTMAATALKRAVSEPVAREFYDKQLGKTTDLQAKKRLEETRASLFR